MGNALDEGSCPNAVKGGFANFGREFGCSLAHPTPISQYEFE